MNTTDQGIYPRQDALPTKGKFKYLRWCETFHWLTTSYMENAEKIRELDLALATVYDREIESLMRKASAFFTEFEVII